MVRKGYRNLSIPEQLFIELQQFVEESKGRYVSVAEVTREAIREFLDKRKQGRSSSQSKFSTRRTLKQVSAKTLNDSINTKTP